MTIKELYEWAINNNCVNAILYTSGVGGKSHELDKPILLKDGDVYLNKVYEKDYSDTYWR